MAFYQLRIVVADNKFDEFIASLFSLSSASLFSLSSGKVQDSETVIEVL